MNIEQLFEYSMPVLKTDVEKIAVNISGISEGYIKIKNAGGGRLMGEVFSNTESLVFDENKFEGSARLRYEINTASFSPGDRIMSNIVILSTGGEANIPVIINVMPKPFSPDERYTLFSVRDFYSYAKAEPVAARRCLLSSEFMLWLKSIGFEHMDVLEEIINDPNKERAIDNFFVLSGTKKKVDLLCDKNIFEYKLDGKKNEILNGIVSLKKTAPGYINAKVYKKKNKRWLNVFCDGLRSSDFDDELKTEVYFEIDTALIRDEGDEEEIIFEADKAIGVKIRAIKLPAASVKINKQCFGFEDSGEIRIKNNSGERLAFYIKASESCIKLSRDKFYVGDSAVIPFRVKASIIAKNMLELQRIPYIDVKISLTTFYKGERMSFHKNILVGAGIDVF